MVVYEDLIYGWVSTHCGRGTSDILWSCLATIFLCVWTVIHLPIPLCSRIEDGVLVPGEPEPSMRGRIVGSGIVLALIGVIVPEFLIAMAVLDLLEAWKTQKEMQRLTRTKWTLTHSFFLHMGGFCLESSSGVYLQIEKCDIDRAVARGLISSNHPLDWLTEVYKVSEVQIQGRAKSDRLTKFIACSQALWLVGQVVSRACQHEAVTLLEISAVAYAVCALTAYIAWWKKPQGCVLAIMIPCSAEAIPQRFAWNMRLYHCPIRVEEFVWAGQDFFKHLNAPTIRFGGEDMSLDYPISVLSLALFGAVHFASWDITLLSHVEQWLWRASVIYCCTSGMLVYVVLVFYYCCGILGWNPNRRLSWSVTAIRDIVGCFYIIFRLYMIVEVFVSLRALPRSAYESVRWTSFLPHI